MKLMIRVLCTLFMAGALLNSADRPSTVEDFLNSGYATWKAKGPGEFLAFVTEGTPLAGSKEIQTRVDQLAFVQRLYGKVIKADPPKILHLSESVILVWSCALLEKGPVFFKYVFYKSENGTMSIPTFEFATNPDDSLVRALLQNGFTPVATHQRSPSPP